MPQTYEPIATSTLGSAANSVTFSSVPATYTDLRVVFLGKLVTGSGIFFGVTFNNNDGTGNSNNIIMHSDGTTFGGSQLGDQSQGGGTFYDIEMATTYDQLIIVDIFSYANTSIYKTYLATLAGDQAGSYGTVFGAARSANTWANTAAINTVKVRTGTGNFATGTKVTLFGIKAA